jgi:hypothetical protein
MVTGSWLTCAISLLLLKNPIKKYTFHKNDLQLIDTSIMILPKASSPMPVANLHNLKQYNSLPSQKL